MMDYYLPKTVEEAIELLAREEASILAGATDLLIQQKGNPPKRSIVDISRIPTLGGIRETSGGLILGPLVTFSQLINSPLINAACPLLSLASRQVGSPQIRNQGTLGGNIANASPAGDGLVALWALGADLRVQGLGIDEVRSIYQAVRGPKETSLAKGELITEIRVPVLRDGWGCAFEKFAARRASAISVVNAAAIVRLNRERIVEDIRIAVGAVALTPLRLRAVEDSLRGSGAEEDLIGQTSQRSRNVIQPIDDIRGSAWYRMELVPVLVKRAILAARDKALMGRP